MNEYTKAKPLFKSLLVMSLLIVSQLPNPGHADSTDQKLEFIQQHFDAESRRSKLWQNGWFAFIAGNALFNTASYQNAEDSEARTDFTTGAFTGLLGTVSLLTTPLKTHDYAKQLSELPSDTPAQTATKLATAESWLQQSATREQQERSLKSHVKAGVVHAIAGTAVASNGDRDKEGLTTFLTGFLVSELKIWTAPNISTKALKQYQSGDYAITNSHKKSWLFSSNGSLVSAKVHF